MKTVIRLFLLFTLASLGFAADEGRQSQEDNIRETVFRYQFDHNASGQQKGAKMYYLGVGKEKADPSDEFMKRFAANKPLVGKASAAHFIRGKLLDKKTAERGLAFYVTNIKWISDGEVEVSGGYYESGYSSSEHTYTVKMENGKWRLTKDKMEWIS